ncbi:cytochrome P450 [Streptomyces sulfonofaciens]|uniref:Cytochrome P450 n=1 Tax=Streptomyces sulfonofaciens TaxID=68272 RepID=A0A919GG54_9ACTN|nr:cytochrome P450 [Streptomyces sulfonofaciens]GHH83867.1 cytochrome P450 [Streptomyces sulfonofaciens]
MTPMHLFDEACSTTDLLELMPPLALQGDVVRYRYGGQDRLLLNDPEDTYRVVADPRKQFAALPLLQRVMGEGLLVAHDLERWKPRRLVVQREMSPGKVAKHAGLVMENTRRVVDSWSPGQRISLRDEVNRLALDNLGDTVFGEEFAGHREIVRETLELLLEAFDALESGQRNELLEQRLEESITKLEAALAGIVDGRRASAGDPVYVLDVLIRAAKSGDPVFADPFIRDESITMMIAGYDTTAFIIGAATVLLARHPEARQRLRAEVEAARTAEVAPEKFVKAVPFARLVIAETLRLYPPIPFMHRPLLEDQVIAGQTLPEGTLVTASAWVAHHSPKLFKDPLVFDPDRFSPERRTEIPRHAYFPFGMGQRTCVGNHFAMLSMAIAVALIAADTDLRFDSTDLAIEAPITLRFADEALATVTDVRGRDDRPGRDSAEAGCTRGDEVR